MFEISSIFVSLLCSMPYALLIQARLASVFSSVDAEDFRQVIASKITGTIINSLQIMPIDFLLFVRV